ncbi:o-succinylbenzoate synthase [Peribacillus sp. SCS-155]|uniref:o-succinylbenzoate synthase n=1 Tax=Peribacillus sedimenti TaxID=3115297 RepID=UPI0039068E52
MKIQSISMQIICSDLKIPFQTHLETVKKREAIVIKVTDTDGLIGYGEAVPFSSPWYTEETIKSCYHILKDFIIPKILQNRLQHPKDLAEIWKGIRRNAMAKSGMEQAVWDLYAKQQGIYIGKLFGGERSKVAAGVVIATPVISDAIRQIEEYKKDGYKRFKIKISPRHDLEMLDEIRKAHPDIALLADANSAYSLHDADHIKRLDQYGLAMIEQPLGHDDIVEHSFLQKQIKTPICLDESISSFHDAKSALLIGSCQIINIKMARVGGWKEAVEIHDLCLENGVPVWVGGMIEFGISRAHNIALASLAGFTIPGDLSSSSKYWEQDIIEPEVIVSDGLVDVPERSGIGFSVHEKNLDKLTIYSEIFTL